VCPRESAAERVADLCPRAQCPWFNRSIDAPKIRPIAGARLVRALGFVLFSALVFEVALQPLWHDDIFWHLRTGEIVAHTGKVPRVDSFTHTVQGEPWTSHEWGFALLLYTVYRSFGLEGLVWLMAAMTWLVFAALYRHMRHSRMKRVRRWPCRCSCSGSARLHPRA
jgi:hypothetical protein